MPKQLITVIGLIVSLGVIALGIVLVAVPLWVQSLAVDSQTATVATANSVYEAQVAALEAEKERQSEIDASVAALREEIPARNQFDDVFEVISGAAESSGVTITSATAGDVAPFVMRTAATAPGDQPVQAPPPAEDPTDAAEEAASPEADAQTEPDAVAPPAADAPLAGRQQVDFAIVVTANDMAQATAFLDALRRGPRLLDSIKATATQTGTAVDLQISALAFIDSEE